MNEEVKGRCSWCNGVIMERSSHIISMVTPKTLYCGKSCADAATRYERSLQEPLVVEQKQEAGHCGACRHWSKGPAYQDEWGTCYTLTRSASPYVQNRSNLFALPKAPQPFNTNKDFGCVAFAPKGEE